MGQGRLEDFGGYRKSLVLFDAVAEDLSKWSTSFQCSRLASQQLASADSVCANMEEGFGRESRKEFRHYLVIARGSVRETSGRYRRLRHWIPPDVVQERVALADEISKILTATINRLHEPP